MIYTHLFFVVCFMFSTISGNHCKNKTFSILQTDVREVSGGKYINYSLDYYGSLLVFLTSKSGDADIYLSSSIETPTYEPTTYDLQSATCGFDVIHIPENFKRPIHISVYGHPSADVSSFVFDVVHTECPLLIQAIDLENYKKSAAYFEYYREIKQSVVAWFIRNAKEYWKNYYDQLKIFP